MKTQITMETKVEDIIELHDLEGKIVTLTMSNSVQELYTMYNDIEELQTKFKSLKSIKKYGVDNYAEDILKILLGIEYPKIKNGDYTLKSKENLIKTIIKDILTPRVLSFTKGLTKKYAKKYAEV